jgi:non-ribosomal peptide synthetase component F
MSRIEQLIFAQALKTPDAVAVRHNTLRWSYTELSAAANDIASLLRAEFDVPRNALIGVFMERSSALIASILGVLSMSIFVCLYVCVFLLIVCFFFFDVCCVCFVCL